MTLTETGTCVCGEPRSLGYVHRTDGPCYWGDVGRSGVTVDAGALAEIQEFVRELRPMLDQLRELEARWVELQPFLTDMRPMLAQLGAVAKGGAPELLAYLLGRRPAPPAPLGAHNPATSGYNPNPFRR